MGYKNQTVLCWIIIIAIGILTLAYAVSSQTLSQPPAAIRDVIDDYFGTKIVDPYRWMEEPKSTELSEWMKTQNAYTRSKLDAMPVRGEFLKRIEEMTNAYPSVSQLSKTGDSYFYLKFIPGDPDRKLYVRSGLNGEERLLVDPAKISDGGKRYSITAFSPSQDGLYVSYLISAGGTEIGEIRIVETATGRDTGERITRARWEAGSWRPDNKSFLYVRFPEMPADASANGPVSKDQTRCEVSGGDADAWNKRPACRAMVFGKNGCAPPGGNIQR